LQRSQLFSFTVLLFNAFFSCPYNFDTLYFLFLQIGGTFPPRRQMLGTSYILYGWPKIRVGRHFDLLVCTIRRHYRDAATTRKISTSKRPGNRFQSDRAIDPDVSRDYLRDMTIGMAKNRYKKWRSCTARWIRLVMRGVRSDGIKC